MRLHFDVTGDGPPVLLVMGLGMTGAMWKPVLPALSAHHACATFDHRGLGRSDDGAPVETISHLADDALRVLDELGWERPHVVGVSMGGMIAQELALRRPDRVRSLALLVTHSGGRLAALPPLRGLAVLLSTRDRATRLERLLYPPGTEVPRERSAAMLAQRVPRGTLRAQVRAITRHDTRARLHALSMPTLVVKAGRDLLVRPSHADRLVAGIPGARLLDLPGAGHGLVLTHADRLAEALLEHFRQA